MALAFSAVLGALCSVVLAVAEPALVNRIPSLWSLGGGFAESTLIAESDLPASNGAASADSDLRVQAAAHDGDRPAAAEQPAETSPAVGRRAALAIPGDAVAAVQPAREAAAVEAEDAGAAASPADLRPPPTPPDEGAASPQASGPWDVLYERAHALRRAGDLQAAIDHFREAARLNPVHAALLYDWGYALQQQGERSAAIEKYRQAIEVDPSHAYAHYNLGSLLHLQGDEAAAIAHYERSGEIRPDNAYLYRDWGWLLERRGEIARAAERYRRAIDLAPESLPGTDARRRLAQLGVDG